MGFASRLYGFWQKMELTATKTKKLFKEGFNCFSPIAKLARGRKVARPEDDPATDEDGVHLIDERPLLRYRFSDGFTAATEKAAGMASKASTEARNLGNTLIGKKKATFAKQNLSENTAQYSMFAAVPTPARRRPVDVSKYWTIDETCPETFDDASIFEIGSDDDEEVPLTHEFLQLTASSKSASTKQAKPNLGFSLGSLTSANSAASVEAFYVGTPRDCA